MSNVNINFWLLSFVSAKYSIKYKSGILCTNFSMDFSRTNDIQTIDAKHASLTATTVKKATGLLCKIASRNWPRPVQTIPNLGRFFLTQHREAYIVEKCVHCSLFIVENASRQVVDSKPDGVDHFFSKCWLVKFFFKLN
jgi:hypothetical protein